MNLEFTPEEDAFRAEVRAFIEENYPEELKGFGSREDLSKEDFVKWHKILGKKGWSVPSWPEKYGGTGWTSTQKYIWSEENARMETIMPLPFGVSMVAPVIYTFGNEEQKAEHLPGIRSGEVWWCQGYSEPGAGSDLASLKTTAVRDGDHYVINGQKTWTTLAQHADWIFILCRTDPDAKKPQEGISFILAPMDTPGIEVRPIPSLIGEGDIHETFFTDVRVPATARLGEEGQAWSIISYSLANERVGIPRSELGARALEQMVRMLKARGTNDDSLIRARAGAASAACEAARLLVYRVVDQRARGVQTGAEANVARAAVIAAEHAVADFGMEFLPEAFTGAGHPLLMAHHERAIVSGVAAGAAEIQLNLIARRYLDLPSEPK